MSKEEAYIEEVLQNWFDIIKPKKDLNNIIEIYGKKFKGVKMIDWKIEGKSIFVTPEGEDEQPIHITIKCDTWDDIDF